MKTQLNETKTEFKPNPNPKTNSTLLDLRMASLDLFIPEATTSGPSICGGAWTVDGGCTKCFAGVWSVVDGWFCAVRLG